MNPEVATQVSTGKFVWIAGGVPKLHDKRIYDHFGLRNRLVQSREFGIADKGYDGAQMLYTPYKKKKNTDLSLEEESWNRTLAVVRIHVERAIGRIKSFKAFSTRWRGSYENGEHFSAFQFIASMINISSERKPLIREIPWPLQI